MPTPNKPRFFISKNFGLLGVGSSLTEAFSAEVILLRSSELALALKTHTALQSVIKSATAGFSVLALLFLFSTLTFVFPLYPNLMKE